MVTIPNVSTRGSKGVPRPPVANTPEERWVFYPNSSGGAPPVTDKPVRRREGRQAPLFMPASDKKEVMYSQTKGIKKSSSSVVLYGRTGGAVPLVKR